MGTGRLNEVRIHKVNGSFCINLIRQYGTHTLEQHCLVSVRMFLVKMKFWVSSLRAKSAGSLSCSQWWSNIKIWMLKGTQKPWDEKDPSAVSRRQLKHHELRHQASPLDRTEISSLGTQTLSVFRMEHISTVILLLSVILDWNYVTGFCSTLLIATLLLIMQILQDKGFLCVCTLSWCHFSRTFWLIKFKMLELIMAK